MAFHCRFPAWCRGRVQAALTIMWTTAVPFLMGGSPAQYAARVLKKELGSSIRDYVFIDFCAGGGGPTPSIEQEMNRRVDVSKTDATAAEGRTSKDTATPSYAEVAAPGPTSSTNGVHSDTNNNSNSDNEAVQFVLTDLHPHVPNWAEAAAKSPNMHYEAQPVDAANAPASLIQQHRASGKRIFRLFNLAFHHFDDPLARAILRNTMENSDGFAILELQGRSFSAFIACCAFGLGIMVLAPVYAWKWRSFMTLFFAWVVPILPFVLVFDGWISSLRSRTPDEVEALLRTCDAAGGEEEVKKWELRSGEETFLWPFGTLHWIVCVKRDGCD
jgi:hypothetical protein